MASIEKELATYAKQRKVYAGKQGTNIGNGAGLEAGEMDFEEDRFADDEEHDDLFIEDEDAKDAEKRIKEDQLKANVFDLKDEKEYDAEEMREKREREARRVLGKGVRKALKKRERNFDYSSGSDVNPYTDEEVKFHPFVTANPRLMWTELRRQRNRTGQGGGTEEGRRRKEPERSAPLQGIKYPLRPTQAYRPLEKSLSCWISEKAWITKRF